ncbi:hypothetical protein GVN20_05530 [Runella sp. CRIBMP]|uniref:hypothetical protein n=1 Tax=Runella sp. CRIBMP TaxID=2683261 RepID=UPI0014125E31|nr:hypothetical protein [Runella sp. CRIBMP]NBB18811.1 hypothetical protein [Runella sp. CRIBMP]
MDTQGKIRPGRQARIFRKERIKELLSVVKGLWGWRSAFLVAYPEFDSAEGGSLLTMGVLGRTDDPDLLAALEIWIPKIQKEQPDWFTKSETLPQS